MKFRSRSDNETIRLASTSGDILLIGSEFVEIPPHMEAEAYAKGCVSEEIYKSIRADIERDATAKTTLVSGALTDEQRVAAIKMAMNAMLDSNEDGNFTAQGLPHLKKLSSLAGFTVSKEEMESIWAEVSATSDGQ